MYGQDNSNGDELTSQEAPETPLTTVTDTSGIETTGELPASAMPYTVVPPSDPSDLGIMLDPTASSNPVANEANAAFTSAIQDVNNAYATGNITQSQYQQDLANMTNAAAGASVDANGNVIPTASGQSAMAALNSALQSMGASPIPSASKASGATSPLYSPTVGTSVLSTGISSTALIVIVIALIAGFVFFGKD